MKKWICLWLAALVLLLTGCDSRDYKTAVALYEAGNYAQASPIFAQLGDYEDSARMVTACQYQIAQELYEKQEFLAAETAFLQLGDYEDSADMVLRCRYGQGLRLLDEKAYPEAEEIFTALGQWEDSADLVLRCRYEQGKEFLAAEDYAGAMELFSGLAEYQDAPALLEQARWKQLHSFLIRQPFADVDGGCLVGITAFDPDQLTLWVEKTMDLGFYVVTDRCEISFTLGQAQGQYLLQTQTQTKADGLTGRSSTTASGAVELASLTADTLLPLTNVSFYGEDVYGNIYHDSLTWGAVLTNPQGLLKTLLEHIPAILEQSGAGYTLQELGLGEF